MATIAQVDRIPTDEEIFAWEPPQSYLGMPVSFYRSGHQEDGKLPEFGFVVRPSSKTKKTLDIVLPGSGQVMTSVRHVSDLKLLKNPNTRENGVWAYTSERVTLHERLDALEAQSQEGTEDRLAKIENRLHALSIKLGQLTGKKKDEPEAPEGI